MDFRRIVKDKLNELLGRQNQLTYRPLICYMERYAEALRYFSGYDDYGIALDYYLKLFNSVEDIKTETIEKNFDIIVQKFFPGMINYDEFAYLKKEGIYCIFNDDNEVVYVGKSKNLSQRALQSFICKFPNGAVYLRVLPTKYKDEVEAVLIDYFNPIYNSRKEQFNLTDEEYDSIKYQAIQKLSETKRIYPTSKKYDWVESEKDIFNNIEDTLRND